GPVATEDADDFAPGNVERHVAQRPHLLVAHSPRHHLDQHVGRTRVDEVLLREMTRTDGEGPFAHSALPKCGFSRRNTAYPAEKLVSESNAVTSHAHGWSRR